MSPRVQRYRDAEDSMRHRGQHETQRHRSEHGELLRMIDNEININYSETNEVNRLLEIYLSCCTQQTPT